MPKAKWETSKWKKTKLVAVDIGWFKRLLVLKKKADKLRLSHLNYQPLDLLFEHINSAKEIIKGK